MSSQKVRLNSLDQLFYPVLSKNSSNNKPLRNLDKKQEKSSAVDLLTIFRNAIQEEEKNHKKKKKCRITFSDQQKHYLEGFKKQETLRKQNKERINNLKSSRRNRSFEFDKIIVDNNLSKVSPAKSCPKIRKRNRDLKSSVKDRNAATASSESKSRALSQYSKNPKANTNEEPKKNPINKNTFEWTNRRITMPIQIENSLNEYFSFGRYSTNEAEILKTNQPMCTDSNHIVVLNTKINDPAYNISKMLSKDESRAEVDFKNTFLNDRLRFTHKPDDTLEIFLVDASERKCFLMNQKAIETPFLNLGKDEHNAPIRIRLMEPIVLAPIPIVQPTNKESSPCKSKESLLSLKASYAKGLLYWLQSDEFIESVKKKSSDRNCPPQKRCQSLFDQNKKLEGESPRSILREIIHKAAFEKSIDDSCTCMYLSDFRSIN